MSSEALNQLQPMLMALEDVVDPDVPVSVLFQECQNLIAFIDQNPPILEGLYAVGLEPSHLPDLQQALDAARQAEAVWSAVRTTRKPEEQALLEEEGRAMRSEAVAAFRYSLRTARDVQYAIDRVVEGTGVPDLVMDLDTLATLVERNLAGFARNKKFDAPRKISLLRDKAEQIRLGLSEFRSASDRKDAHDLRNRAWTYFDDLFTELRHAGQHAFMDTIEVQEFYSDYNRRKRLARKRKT